MNPDARDEPAAGVTGGADNLGSTAGGPDNLGAATDATVAPDKPGAATDATGAPDTPGATADTTRQPGKPATRADARDRPGTAADAVGAPANPGTRSDAPGRPDTPGTTADGGEHAAGRSVPLGAMPPRGTGSVPIAGHIQTSPATPEVEMGLGSTAMPGVHRGGFQRLPTAPVDVPATGIAPSEDLDQPVWPAGERTPSRNVLSFWSLGLSVLALASSFFVGWTFPLGIAGVIVAIIALRRPLESRLIAGWALALSILSIAYSAGWLIWLMNHPELFE